MCELSDEEDDDFGSFVVSSEFSVEISSGIFTVVPLNHKQINFDFEVVAIDLYIYR
jgi:hypothetical protein